MSSMRFALASLVACLAALPPAAANAGDAAAGKAKSAACAACHGPDGNSTNPEWPKLAGQGARYLEKQLQDFKAGKRVNAIMNGLAAPLSDADIGDLSAYFASQKVRLGTADPASVKLGERLYRGGNSASGVAACMSCHGPSGKGNPLARFPSLSGQQAAYVAKALQDYRSGARENDPSAMMRRIAERLTEREIKAVSQYVSGLHG
ncbi:MAG: cytochrome c subfamily [Chromatiaceae bacterium]|nr:cytochrome c subfamily [Chromatiaceae bacterium]